jgi:hypothetical protein
MLAEPLGKADAARPAAACAPWALLTRRRGALSGVAYDWREATVNVVSWTTAMVAWFPIDVATYLTNPPALTGIIYLTQ